MDEKLLPSIAATVRIALEEDIGSGDITGELIDPERHVSARIVCKESGTLCGAPWAEEVLRQIDPDVTLNWRCEEGDTLVADAIVATLQGSARAIMAGERTLLNFLQTLSGTATEVKRLVSLVAHTEVVLLDTRKTLPGLREAQKYAVRVGGGRNHRMGLFDAYLIKENHIVACGGINAAVSRARQLHAAATVEVEVQDLEELRQALAAGADIIMLDNFAPDAIQEAVKITGGRAKLEASGGIDQESLVNFAESGVDYISVGAMTKHCRALDLSLLIAL